MPKSKVKNKKCLICGFNMKQVSDSWFQCEYCGHLIDIRNPHADEHLYGDEYYKTYAKHDNDVMQSLLVKDRGFWELIHEYTPGVKTVIDYGCGIGHFFKSAPPEYGVKAVGYEPHRKEFNNKELLTKKYDMMVALHVLEHFDDPHDLLKAVDHDYFMFSIPWGGTNKADNQISMGALWSWYTWHRPGEHKQCFTRKSLNIFFRDYDIITENYLDGKGQNPDHPEFIITQIRRKRR